MKKTQLLLTRLDEIGRSLAASGHALALIGLGSVGRELERLDAYSDLDFFAVVEAGYKKTYIEDLSWLSGVRPIAYQFPNTKDGCKLLFEDGIFCEFAVFELEELKTIPFAPGRVVWKQPFIDDSIALPAVMNPAAASRPADWLVGEAITNLYVGLGRLRRGEKLSAARFIQGYAVDRLLDLAAYIEPEMPAFRDPFNPERRCEQRFPGLADELRQFMQGYEGSAESALAILAFLERHFEVNPAMAKAIRELSAGKI
jgi:lincosamide nucleotidyltransferase B/F